MALATIAATGTKLRIAVTPSAQLDALVEKATIAMYVRACANSEPNYRNEGPMVLLYDTFESANRRRTPTIIVSISGTVKTSFKFKINLSKCGSALKAKVN